MQLLAVGSFQFGLAMNIDNRTVILIDENDYLPPGPFIDIPYQSVVGGIIRIRRIKFFLPFVQSLAEGFAKVTMMVITPVSEIKTQYRVAIPFFRLKTIDGKTLKQLSLSMEIAFHR